MYFHHSALLVFDDSVTSHRDSPRFLLRSSQLLSKPSFHPPSLSRSKIHFSSEIHHHHHHHHSSSSSSLVSIFVTGVLIVTIELDLHRARLELDAVEPLDRRLRLLAGLEEHGAPPLAAAGVRVAHRIRLDDVANLLKHLSEVLARGRPREVADDDLKPGGGFGAARVGAAAGPLGSAARALEADDDGAALEVGVVERRDGGLRRGGGLEVDEAPALAAAAGLLRDFSVDDGADGGEVRCRC